MSPLIEHPVSILLLDPKADTKYTVAGCHERHPQKKIKLDESRLYAFVPGKNDNEQKKKCTIPAYRARMTQAK